MNQSCTLLTNSSKVWVTAVDPYALSTILNTEISKVTVQDWAYYYLCFIGSENQVLDLISASQINGKARWKCWAIDAGNRTEKTAFLRKKQDCITAGGKSATPDVAGQTDRKTVKLAGRPLPHHNLSGEPTVYVPPWSWSFSCTGHHPLPAPTSGKTDQVACSPNFLPLSCPC